jgi:cobalt/nickel transport system permease protein
LTRSWNDQRWSGTWKLGLALGQALAVSLIPVEHWPGIGVIGCLVLLEHAWIETPTAVLLRRFLQFSPLLFVFLLAGTRASTETASGLWLAVMALRAVVTFLIGLWLAAVMTSRELLQTLRRWRCPELLLVILGFQLRYVAVLWDEHERLLRAQLARAGGPQSRWQAWRQALDRVALLLLRSLDRAERVHQAMLSRGWDGSLRGWE